MQRKEGRRLNLHQNVWLPVLGKGRGSGGGWKGRKPGKTALPNREMGKRPRFYTRSGAFHELLEQSPIRALSSKSVKHLKGSFPKHRVRRHQRSRFETAVSTPGWKRSVSRCWDTLLTAANNGQLHWKFWKLGLFSTPTIRLQVMPMLSSHLEIGDTLCILETLRYSLLWGKTNSCHRGNSVWLFLVEGASKNKTLNDTEMTNDYEKPNKQTDKKKKTPELFLVLCLQKSAGDDLRAEKFQLLLHGHTPEHP